jgi:hypothetical protein
MRKAEDLMGRQHEQQSYVLYLLIRIIATDLFAEGRCSRRTISADAQSKYL